MWIFEGIVFEVRNSIIYVKVLIEGKKKREGGSLSLLILEGIVRVKG